MLFPLYWPREVDGLTLDIPAVALVRHTRIQPWDIHSDSDLETSPASINLNPDRRTEVVGKKYRFQ